MVGAAAARSAESFATEESESGDETRSSILSLFKYRQYLTRFPSCGTCSRASLHVHPSPSKMCLASLLR
eukprot:scaffold39729_cov594-Skeletonema_dohrnii-CCMP3373.AAC.1